VNFLDLEQDCQKLGHYKHRHRDRHTNATKLITTAAFAGGKNNI